MILLSKAKYLRVNYQLDDFKVVHVSVLQCCLQSGKEQRASLPGERMEQCFFRDHVESFWDPKTCHMSYTWFGVPLSHLYF